MNLKDLYYYLSKMNKVGIFVFSIFCVVISLSCEKEESETEDDIKNINGE